MIHLDNVSYCLVDSSQLIHLCGTQKIATLDSPNFIAKYGYPFLTTHNIFEMAGTDDLELFRKRLTMLSSLKNAYSLNLLGIESVGSLPTLHAIELLALVELGPCDYTSIRQFIRQYIRRMPLVFTEEEVGVIYEKSAKLKEYTSFLATFNNEMLSPAFDMPVGNLRGRTVDLRNAAGLADKFRDVLRSKGITGETAEKMVSTLLFGQERTRSDFEQGSDALLNLQRMIGREIDPKVGLDTYMNSYLFREHIAQCAKLLSRPLSDFEHIKESDSRVFQIEVRLKRHLENKLARDARRKVELGNTTDIHLAAYALIVDMFADKRTVELTNEVNAKLKFDLAMHRVVYEF